MFRAEGSADFIHPLGGNAHGIAAAVTVALRLEQPRPLFLWLIRWPVIAPPLDIQAGMGESPQQLRQGFQPRPQELARHGVAHLAFEADLDCRFLVELAVSGIGRQHGVNEFMNEDAQDLVRIPIVSDTYSDNDPDSVPTFIRTKNRG